MRTIPALALALALALSAATTVSAQSSSQTDWDGLTRINSRNFDAAFLAPDADFSGFTQVMLDPTEVAFRRNWQRDQNNSAITLSRRISDEEARRILDATRTGFEDVFAEEYRRAGFQVVTEPGPDVLRVRTAVVNLSINAPDQMTAGRSRTYAAEAGQATLILEVRDSMSGALLGRAVDSRRVGDNAIAMRRTRVSNTADFRRAFTSWARASVDAFNRLRTETPVPTAVGSP